MNMASSDIITVPCNCAHELVDRIETDINIELKHADDLKTGRLADTVVAVEVSIDLDGNLASFRTASSLNEAKEVASMVLSADYINCNGCSVPVSYLFWSGAGGYIDYQTVKKWVLGVFRGLVNEGD